MDKVGRLICICLLAAACGSVEPKDQTLPDIDPYLVEKEQIYKNNMQFDDWGWIAPECDGLLFNSLFRLTGGSVDLYRAEQAPGRWRRHPNFDRCKPGNGAKSDISRDMFRGLFLVLLLEKDYAALERIARYGEQNAWIMGEGELSRTMWNPIIINQLYRMLKKSPTQEYTSFPGPLPDYEGHLRVLSILTEFIINKSLASYELSELKKYAEKNPKNTLYQILASKFTGQQADLTTLYNESYFPRRPIKDTDRYTHYLWQRDFNEDWQPCGSSEKRPCESVTHTGLDYLVAMWLLRLDFRSL